MLAIMAGSGRSPWLTYTVAVTASLAALGLKLALVPLVTKDEPGQLFFAAVMIAALFGGMGPGLVATALCSAFDNWFFMTPYNQFGLKGFAQHLRLEVFVAQSVFVSWICARVLLARQRAEQSENESRELQSRMLDLTETEQRKIGHDLHDGLGQQLTGIALMARRLQQQLAPTASPLADDAAKVADLAKHAVGWTHDLSRTLSPHALETGGLPEALRELAAHAESIFGIECTYSQAGELKPPPTAASVHLYRIAQEAISNAVKHGKAKHVQLVLETAENGMTMSVIDDGSGLRAPAASVDGMGLRIMRYRAEMIGATIDIKQGTDGGTAVVCNYHANV